MNKSHACLLLLILFSGIQALYADLPVVRVRIIHAEDKIELSFNAKVTITSAENNKLALRGKNHLFLSPENERMIISDIDGEVILKGKSLRIDSNDPGKSIEIKNVPFGNGWWWAGEEDRSYPGDLEFYINNDNTIDVINIVNIEDYLYGVLPAEIGTEAPAEALKAQAVCARSEALIGLETGKYAGAHYDLTADVMTQVYQGVGETNEAVRKAVDATGGEVLAYKDTVISAYYSSNCGGHTEDIENIWPERSGHRPYWSGNPDMEKATTPDLRQSDNIRDWIENEPDAWCRTDENTPEWAKNNFRWKRSVEPGELSKALSAKYHDVGRIYDIVPLERGISGRINDIIFIGDSGHIRIKGELEIRRLWDSPLRSSCFVVDKIGPSGRPASFIISGAGWGHGVGMCQVGAIAMAEKGKTYQDILSHYFRGSHLQKKYK
ncbi:MAG: SpoIID/LytB domain-containing protein [Candidatus Marinimicrobia bacterium]|nr:SpoIID/LytB domain-containing protein [Candidatus Neomarinimicrobiota bacterium]